jgi:hypothetical protein
LDILDPLAVANDDAAESVSSLLSEREYDPTRCDGGGRRRDVTGVGLVSVVHANRSEMHSETLERRRPDHIEDTD